MKKIMLAVTIFWLAAVGSASFWSINDAVINNEKLAFATARALFTQIVVTRSWNAFHGGVYVPVSKEKNVLPNTYLKDPLREIYIDQNLTLTKINPAYMTRQIAEIASKNEYGIQFHITSLNPIRAANKPAQWEKEWLESFESGQKERGVFFTENENSGFKNGFRYMAPLFVEKSCLKCHAEQGYKEGDIRGGISVTLPDFSDKINSSLFIGYGMAAVLGLFFIIISGAMLQKKQLLLLKANSTLIREIEDHQSTIKELKNANAQVKQLSGIIPICMHCKEIRDDKGYWNQLEKFISEHSQAQFSHSICDKCLKKHYPEYI